MAAVHDVPDLGLPTSSSPPPPVLVLVGDRTPVRDLVVDLVRARQLLLVFAAHDFRARYRSASLGLLWTVLLPLLQGAVFAVVFTRVVKIPLSNGVPYASFVISGTLAWSYVTTTLTAGATSIVDGGDIAGKVYFPRMLLPAVPAIANLPSLGISLLVAFGVALASGVAPTLWILLLPVAALLLALLGLLTSEVTALLHVYFRDVRYLVSAVVILALYVSPVIYPLSRAHSLRPLLIANPASGPLQLVRQALLGQAPGGLALPLLTSLAWMAALAVTSVLAFSRHERIAVDRL